VVEGEKVYFDVTFSGEDVRQVQRALMKRFKADRDEPVKTVVLALVVAELEVLLYKSLMGRYCMNLDEVIAGLRWQAQERAKYLSERS
jgi:hypothetical protein